MNDKQKSRRSFRNSKIWKDFRHKKNVEQKGLDLVTKCKLTKTANLHHCLLDLDEEEYKDISNDGHFIMINKSTHDAIHWCLRYVKKYKDMSVIDNLYNEVLREAILNKYIGE